MRKTIGYCMMTVGLLIEACAVLAMTSCPLRQRLPCRSPFTLLINSGTDHRKAGSLPRLRRPD